MKRTLTILGVCLIAAQTWASQIINFTELDMKPIMNPNINVELDSVGVTNVTWKVNGKAGSLFNNMNYMGSYDSWDANLLLTKLGTNRVTAVAEASDGSTLTTNLEVVLILNPPTVFWGAWGVTNHCTLYGPYATLSPSTEGTIEIANGTNILTIPPTGNQWLSPQQFVQLGLKPNTTNYIKEWCTVDNIDSETNTDAIQIGNIAAPEYQVSSDNFHTITNNQTIYLPPIKEYMWHFYTTILPAPNNTAQLLWNVNIQNQKGTCNIIKAQDLYGTGEIVLLTNTLCKGTNTFTLWTNPDTNTYLPPYIPHLLLSTNVFTVVITNLPQPFLCETNSNGTLTIIGYQGIQTNLNIPATINNRTVTEIGTNAMYGDAFIHTVQLPSTLKTLGDNAFGECKNLSEINIGAITNLMGGALYGTAITNITIPTNCSTIGQACFYQCTNLTNVDLNETVTIKSIAFQSCPIQSIKWGNRLQNIGAWAFVYTPMSQLKLPNSITELGTGAFASDDNLTNVTIGNNQTNTAANITNGTWGEDPFGACTKLTNITVSTNNNIFSSHDGILYNKAGTYLIQMPLGRTGTLDVPAGVTNIGGYAFQYSKLSIVNFPASLQNIGNYAFNGADVTNIYFAGNAPTFTGNSQLPASFYLPGTMGWNNFTQGTKTCWKPDLKTHRNGNQWDLDISGTNLTVIVEESHDLQHWIPVATNNVNGTKRLTMSQNTSDTFYRLRSPN